MYSSSGDKTGFFKSFWGKKTNPINLFIPPALKTEYFTVHVLSFLTECLENVRFTASRTFLECFICSFKPE